jgi:hypothetical protein
LQVIEEVQPWREYVEHSYENVLKPSLRLVRSLSGKEHACSCTRW